MNFNKMVVGVKIKSRWPNMKFKPNITGLIVLLGIISYICVV